MQHGRPGAQRQPEQGLDGGDMGDHQHRGRSVVGDDAVADPLDAVLNIVEALPARGGEAGVAQPPAVQVGCRSAARRTSVLPLAEVGLGEVLVHPNGEPRASAAALAVS